MESTNDAIWRRAKFLARHSDRNEIQSMTLLIMYDLEMPLNYSGFDYLKNAIPIALERPSQIVLKELFLVAGEQYSPAVSYSVMDSAVHDVIEKAWESSCRKRWGQYFPDYLIQRECPPSNTEFIAGMVYFLEMWQGCCKEGEHAGK